MHGPCMSIAKQCQVCIRTALKPPPERLVRHAHHSACRETTGGTPGRVTPESPQPPMGGIDTATAAVPVTAAAHHIAVPLEERWEQNLWASGVTNGNKTRQGEKHVGKLGKTTGHPVRRK